MKNKIFFEKALDFTTVVEYIIIVSNNQGGFPFMEIMEKKLTDGSVFRNILIFSLPYLWADQ